MRERTGSGLDERCYALVYRDPGLFVYWASSASATHEADGYDIGAVYVYRRLAGSLSSGLTRKGILYRIENLIAIERLVKTGQDRSFRFAFLILMPRNQDNRKLDLRLA